MEKKVDWRLQTLAVAVRNEWMKIFIAKMTVNYSFPCSFLILLCSGKWQIVGRHSGWAEFMAFKFHLAAYEIRHFSSLLSHKMKVLRLTEWVNEWNVSLDFDEFYSFECFSFLWRHICNFKVFYAQRKRIKTYKANKV